MHSYESLGNIMLENYGASACQEGYLSTDPATVGRLALDYGDINRDGSLN